MQRASNISLTIATQRCGTKVLGGCFNAGTQVLGLGEIFHNESTAPTAFSRFAASKPDFAHKYVSGQVESMLDEYFLGLSQLYFNVHFDFMYSNIAFLGALWSEFPSRSTILDHFISRQFAVIHLTRDPKDTYVSLKDAQRSLRFHFTAPGRPPQSNAPLPLANDNLSDLADAYEQYRLNVLQQRVFVDEIFRSYPYYISIDYEQLIADDGFLAPATRDKILGIFGDAVTSERLQSAPVHLIRSPRSPWALELQNLIS